MLVSLSFAKLALALMACVPAECKFSNEKRLKVSTGREFTSFDIRK